MMKKIDAFAQIAAAGINNEGKGLITPEPVELEERYLEVVPLEKAVLFTPLEKIRDKEGLYEEVERQKTYYRPFLADYAPALENRRTRSCLQSFQWRIGTEEDFRIMGNRGEMLLPFTELCFIWKIVKKTKVCGSHLTALIIRLMYL